MLSRLRLRFRDDPHFPGIDHFNRVDAFASQRYRP